MSCWDDSMFGNQINCSLGNVRGRQEDNERGALGVRFICECREVRSERQYHFFGCQQRRRRR